MTNWDPAVAAAPHARRRWPIVLAVLAVVVAVIAAGLVVLWWKRGSDLSMRPDWQPPPETLLSSSMRVQPVPGWHITAAELGLPDHSRLATNDNAFQSKPFIGYLDDRGYFLASTPGAQAPEWWLVGVDAHNGSRLFPAVSLKTTTTAPPRCFLNGPTIVLCLRDGGAAGTAWVIDAQTGAVTFTGPTELRTYPGRLGVEQVGIYAVAGTMNEGVYGVGPKAEPTWFVPGKGSADQQYRARSDFETQSLATQTIGGPGSESKVVFSLNDGAVVSPKLDSDRRPLGAVVYPGGFAVEVGGETGRITSNPDHILFFDGKGRQLGRADVSGKLAINSLDIPIVTSSSGSTVYTIDGHPLAEIPRLNAVNDATLLGPWLFVDEGKSSGFPEWQQYGLRTGSPGTTCKFYVGDAVGTDGEVAVLQINNPGAGFVAKAADLTSCEILWRLPSLVESFAQAWRVNTTLVQLSDDGTELMSLVAPS
jgi:hypothetical protein